MKSACCSVVACPLIPAPSERMLRANRSKYIQLGSWEQSMERAERRIGAAAAGLYGIPADAGTLTVPEGMRQSLCQHQAELLLSMMAEQQLDVLKFR